MSKGVFLILMPLEFLAALIGAAILFPDIGAVIYLIAAAVFIAVLYPFYRRLKKEEDEAKKRKKDPPEHGHSPDDPHSGRRDRVSGRCDHPDNGLYVIPTPATQGVFLIWTS